MLDCTVLCYLINTATYEGRTESHEQQFFVKYEGHTESHEQLFFACELGTADEGEYGGRWNQLFCYP